MKNTRKIEREIGGVCVGAEMGVRREGFNLFDLTNLTTRVGSGALRCGGVKWSFCFLVNGAISRRKKKMFTLRPGEKILFFDIFGK